MKNEKYSHKEYKLNTHDIQRLVIALIYCGDKTTIGEDNRTRLINQLGELNKMCWAGNDYTLTVKIDG